MLLRGSEERQRPKVGSSHSSFLNEVLTSFQAVAGSLEESKRVRRVASSVYAST